MTVYDRPPEVIRAVISALSFPGNQPDRVVVCYDRAPELSREIMRWECNRVGIDLIETSLDDDFEGPRCPSLAWNTAMRLVDDENAVLMSSDMVLTPHSLGMAFHLSSNEPNTVIVGRADHAGTSYNWKHSDSHGGTVVTRTMCSSQFPNPLGFVWLIPTAAYNAIGGYDEAFMKGVCYEDTDFTVRLWEHGCDFLFCDDVAGFHIEHPRNHLRNLDGRVRINCDLFNSRHRMTSEGDKSVLRNLPMKIATFGVGMCMWAHEADDSRANRLDIAQRLYGHCAPWQAIQVDIIK